MVWLLAIDSIDLREVASLKKAANRKKRAGLAGRLKNTPSPPPHSPSTLPPPPSLGKSSRKLLVLVIAETAQAASRGDDL